MVLYPCFTGWHPVTLSGGELTHFINFVKVIQILDVAAVVPSKYIWFFTVDQMRHCFNPARVLDSCQTAILCILDTLKSVTALERITVITD